MNNAKTKKVRITGRQCRAARALLGMKQADLRLATGLSKTTITAFEAGHPDTSRPLPRTVESIIWALTNAGAEFIVRVGVTLREK